MHQRRCMQHSYHDHSQTSPESFEESLTDQSLHSSQHEKVNDKERLDGKKRAGEASFFPSKLHRLLEYSEQNENSHIISWQIHGRAFKIHKPKDFMEKIGPVYFQQTKLASFRRQLYFYGFQRISHGPDKGSYYHEYFLRGKSLLTKRIVCQRVKGSRVKVSIPENEPNFYNMPFMDNLRQGQNEPTLSSTRKNFDTESPAMLMIARSPECHLTANGEGFNPTSCFQDSSVFKILSGEKDSRKEICIDSCFKIDLPLYGEWEFDTFSFEDTIFDDYMKENPSHEEDFWHLS